METQMTSETMLRRIGAALEMARGQIVTSVPYGMAKRFGLYFRQDAAKQFIVLPRKPRDIKPESWTLNSTIHDVYICELGVDDVKEGPNARKWDRIMASAARQLEELGLWHGEFARLDTKKNQMALFP